MQNFMTINGASEVTGLPAYFIREGCKAGTVPHIKAGNKYLVNVPLLIAKLNKESEGGNE